MLKVYMNMLYMQIYTSKYVYIYTDIFIHLYTCTHTHTHTIVCSIHIDLYIHYGHWPAPQECPPEHDCHVLWCHMTQSLVCHDSFKRVTQLFH